MGDAGFELGCACCFVSLRRERSLSARSLDCAFKSVQGVCANLCKLEQRLALRGRKLAQKLALRIQ